MSTKSVSFSELTFSPKRHTSFPFDEPSPTISITSPSGVAIVEISPSLLRKIKSDPFTLKMYLDSNGNPNAIFQGVPLIHGMSFECIKLLNDLKIPINIDQPSEYDGSTVLHEACKSPRNHQLIILLTTELKANPTVQDYEGCFPIDYAYHTTGNPLALDCLEHKSIMDCQRLRMKQFVSAMSNISESLYESYLDLPVWPRVKPKSVLSPSSKWQFK